MEIWQIAALWLIGACSTSFLITLFCPLWVEESGKAAPPISLASGLFWPLVLLVLLLIIPEKVGVWARNKIMEEE